MAINGDGIAPTLAELVALRATAQRRKPARHGRHSITGPAASTLRGRGDGIRRIARVRARRRRAPHRLAIDRAQRADPYQAVPGRTRKTDADLPNTSPLLYFGTRVRFKSTQAARAGAVAAWSAIRDGDRVAALRGTSAEPPVPPASGTRGALRVLDALVRWYERPPADDQGLAVALDHAARLLRPGSRMIVLADPHSVAAIPQSDWPRWAAHHEISVVMLFDALEASPPASSLPFQAGGSRVELDLADAGQRQRWQQFFSEPMQAAVRGLPLRGVRAYALLTIRRVNPGCPRARRRRRWPDEAGRSGPARCPSAARAGLVAAWRRGGGFWAGIAGGGRPVFRGCATGADAGASASGSGGSTRPGWATRRPRRWRRCPICYAARRARPMPARPACRAKRGCGFSMATPGGAFVAGRRAPAAGGGYRREVDADAVARLRGLARARFLQLMAGKQAGKR